MNGDVIDRTARQVRRHGGRTIHTVHTIERRTARAPKYLITCGRMPLRGWAAALTTDPATCPDCIAVDQSAPIEVTA